MNKTPMNQVPNLQNSVYCGFYVLIDLTRWNISLRMKNIFGKGDPGQHRQQIITVTYNDSA